MKRLLSLLLLSVTLFAEFDTTSVHQLISGSIIPENAKHFGLSDPADLEGYALGASFDLYELTDSVVAAYPAKPLDCKTNSLFVPVLVNGEPQFLVMVDKESQKAVSLGFRPLTLELQKMKKEFGAAPIKLYRSFSARSYFFAVEEPQARMAMKSASAAPLPKNLTVLQKGWEKRTRALNDEAVTVQKIKSIEKGVQ